MRYKLAYGKTGHIIEIPDGICPDLIEPRWTDGIRDPQNAVGELIGFIKENERTLKDTWQIYCQAEIQQYANIYLYSDKLDEHTIRKTLLKPVSDIGKLTDQLVKSTGPDASVCIMPEGPQTIPYLKQS